MASAACSMGSACPTRCRLAAWTPTAHPCATTNPRLLTWEEGGNANGSPGVGTFDGHRWGPHGHRRIPRRPPAAPPQWPLTPIHLLRRVARADTLSTVIEGLYDPDAAAQGAPSVRWFLGYDADGAPQFCGLPAHHTCPHRMDCSRCGLFIGGERAKLVHDDPSLLRVTADIPMT